MTRRRLTVVGLIIFLAVLFGTLAAWAQRSGGTYRAAPRAGWVMSPHALSGLPEVDIRVELVDRDGAKGEGLEKEELERALQAALLASDTVRAISPASPPPRARLCLRVTLLPLDGREELIYLVELSVQQSAYVARGNGIWLYLLWCPTWQARAVTGLAPDTEAAQRVSDAIGKVVEQLKTDYFKENLPRKPGQAS